MFGERSAAGPRAGALLPERRRGEAHRRQGWVGGVYPSAQIQGADTGFRRTADIHPRRAQRRAQVCGDSTVQSDGRRARSPHPPQAVPLPLRGEGLNAPERGGGFPCRTRHLAFRAVSTLRRITLREGEWVCRSPHPPRSGPPSPQGEGLNALDYGSETSRSGRFLLTIDY